MNLWAFSTCSAVPSMSLGAISSWNFSMPRQRSLPCADGSEHRHLDGRAAQLEHDLALIGLHGVKRVMDIPVSYADRYVAAMSIHAKLRAAQDASTVHKSTLYEYIVPCCPNRVRATSARLPKPSRLAWLLQGCSRSSTAPAGSRR